MRSMLMFASHPFWPFFSSGIKAEDDIFDFHTIDENIRVILRNKNIHKKKSNFSEKKFKILSRAVIKRQKIHSNITGF